MKFYNVATSGLLLIYKNALQAQEELCLPMKFYEVATFDFQKFTIEYRHNM